MVVTAADLASAATVEQVMARQVVLSSHEQAWRGVEVMQALLPFNELRVPGLGSHTVAINLGRPFVLAGTVDGRASTGTMGMFGAKIVPAGAASDWRWAAGESLNMLHLSVPEPFVREIATGSDLNPDTLELVERIGILDPQIERIGLALLEELRADGLAGRLYAESLAVMLAVHLLRTHASLGSRRMPRQQPGGLSRSALQQVTDYIEANLARDLTLVEIAAVAHLSPYHFARMFKRSTGSSPHQYLIARRVERAKGLLLAGTLTIAQVAAAVGFADQSHFTRQFGSLVGTTPRQFLRDRTNRP